MMIKKSKTVKKKEVDIVNLSSYFDTKEKSFHILASLDLDYSRVDEAIFDAAILASYLEGDIDVDIQREKVTYKNGKKETLINPYLILKKERTREN